MRFLVIIRNNLSPPKRREAGIIYKKHVLSPPEAMALTLGVL